MEKNKYKIKNVQKLLAVTGSIIMLAGGLHFFYTTKDSFEETEIRKTDTVQIVQNIPSGDRTFTESSLTEEEIDKAEKIYQMNADTLILVNKDTKLSEENAVKYKADLRDICDHTLQASVFLYDDLVDMLAAASEEGYQYWISSAYRSRENQQTLIDASVNSYMQNGMSKETALKETLKETMPAGYSEHETGLALDIITSNNPNMDYSQEEEPGNRWLQRHCAEYGFILRYPKNKEDITRIDYEPWHFRYVGKDAAEFIEKHELSLEEFIKIVTMSNRDTERG